jgi:hypothetical protein
MLRKLVLCLLIVAHGVLIFSDVFARERDLNPEKATVVEGSIVRAALNDIRTWITAPGEWRLRELLVSPKEKPSEITVLEVFEPVELKPVFKYSDLVLKVSDKHGMDWRLVASVIAVESSFNPRAVSPKGALGLMQVMPSTAALYRVKSTELFDPKRNIEAGVQHLKMLNTRYSGDLEKVIAAYNSGEGAVDKYRGIPPYKPTQAFVRRVMTRYQNHLTVHPISGRPDNSRSIADPAPVVAY